jgi:hypothetical protein
MKLDPNMIFLTPPIASLHRAEGHGGACQRVEDEYPFIKSAFSCDLCDFRLAMMASDAGRRMGVGKEGETHSTC